MQAQAQLQADQRAAIEAALREEELFLLDVGISNQGFHYWDSAKFFARVGEAFAQAMGPASASVAGFQGIGPTNAVRITIGD